jgi:hypothetical protein
MPMGVRTAALGLWDVIQFGRQLQEKPWRLGEDCKGKRSWLSLRSMVAYASAYPSRRKRVPMKIDEMLALWVPIVKGLATSHGKDELDRCEFEIDRCLAPLLTAPVREIRDFYSQLVAALESDPTVPFFVWSAFKAWHEVILKTAPDEEVVKLKKDLAGEIAAMVEEAVRPDIGAAIRGALQWRAPEALEKVRDAVKAGAKPRLRGRESCLFLCVPDGQGGEATVML